jgi:very-short-patch-repair endonuclease
VPKRISTPNEINLYNALSRRSIKAELQHWDGHKHVDLAIIDPRIYIEVDEIQHFTDPHQIISDFERSHYSDVEGYHTFFVTDQILEDNEKLNQVADALAKVVAMKLKI